MITLSSVAYDDFVPNWKIASSSTLNHIIIFVTEGQLTYMINDHNILLSKGDLLYIPENTYRSGTNLSDLPHQKYSAHFKLNSDVQTLPSLLTIKKVKKTNTRNFNYIKQRFVLLFQHWVGRLPSYDFICHGILLELIGLTEREINEQRLSPRKVEIVEKIKHYILQHYREPIKIADLATQVDRTPNYVTNIFKEVTGQSPVQYLHDIRISAAKDLIVETDMSFVEIADHLGFCDQSYFSKVFKSILGLSPSSLQKLERKKKII